MNPFRRSLVVAACSLVVGPASGAPSPTLPAATSDVRPAANPGLTGGWFAKTEVEGKQRGHWLWLGADGTWRRIEDYFGFRAENRGHWSADGEGAVLDNLDVRLHLSGGKLLLVYRGETLYAFEPCAAMPQALRDLPPFPHTLSETVAILSAELDEPERIVIAGTLAQDLSRFRYGLGTYIRNHFGLWGPNLALLAACKVEHPEDASNVILQALRKHLRNIRPGGREIDELERVVGSLTMAPVPVRRMRATQFVTVINQEVGRALRQKGLRQDAVVFELAPPKTDDERLQRERYRLSYPPQLRAWGQGRRTRDQVGLLANLTAFSKWLRAPNRVVLEPDFQPRWYRTPDRSPDFASARWRDDWFEIETSIEQETSPPDSVRVDAWAMLGDIPPMPVEQAAAYADRSRERIPAGKQPVEIVITGSPAQDTWEWTYAVHSRLEPRGTGDLASYLDQMQTSGRVAIRGRDLMPKSRWRDLRRPPRISLARALDLLRSSHGASIPAAPDGVQIHLRRAAWSTYWYYRIALSDGGRHAGGFVTLDGRVLASPDHGGTAAPETSGQ
jgi:hypothetical protein